MFKKRPRGPRAARASQAAASKSEPGYWRERLFKNTFTYKGKHFEVNNWSIKFQLFGRRKTFSLSSSNPQLAAIEACQIYQTIIAQGWRAVSRRSARQAFRAPIEPLAAVGLATVPETTAAYWKKRLLHRLHAGKPDLPAHREFSVRIEHAGHSQFFPLGTADESKAARQALRIHRTVLAQGWTATNSKFSRELTVALRWLDNPLAWTYFTLHTRSKSDPVAPAERPILSSDACVAIVEPDEGIRLALAWDINNQPGFRCEATYATAAEAGADLRRRNAHFALINQESSGPPGHSLLEELQRVKPGLTGLLFSVYEDSEHLFHHTPGGAVGYLLKRTPPFRILEPIAGSTGPLTAEQIRVRVREYFHGLFNSLSFGPSPLDAAKLTPREHEILGLLSKGKLAKEIAGVLGISVWTVQGHIKSIFEKLKVHSRTEAVVKFLQK